MSLNNRCIHIHRINTCIVIINRVGGKRLRLAFTSYSIIETVIWKVVHRYMCGFFSLVDNGCLPVLYRYLLLPRFSPRFFTFGSVSMQIRHAFAFVQPSRTVIAHSGQRPCPTGACHHLHCHYSHFKTKNIKESL